MKTKSLVVGLAVTCGLGMGLATAQADDSAVRLEGSGQHRKDCDALQLKPFDSGLWGHLSNWSGTPVTAETVKDKPVLIVTFAGWYKPSHSALAKAQQMLSKYGDKGLVVVGVHNPREFATAAKVAGDQGVKFVYAADEAGKFRQGVLADADPDFFVIDRAGNMRFADIDASSIEKAVEIVVDETIEHAAAMPKSTADAAKQREIDRYRTGDTAGIVRPGEKLKVTFTEPSEEAYARAPWPKLINKSNVSEYDQMADKILKEKPLLEFDEGKWLPALPTTKGRVSVIYLLDPTDSDQLAAVPLMNRIQDAHLRDVVVICAAMRADNNSGTYSTEEEKARAAENSTRAMESLYRQYAPNHVVTTAVYKTTPDLGKVVYFLRSLREKAVVLVVGSDNRIRWTGNPFFDEFPPTLDAFIKADPGVQARRKAEDAKAKTENP